MSINVTGPDGRVHSFADGTTGAEIDRQMRQRYGASSAQTQARASAVVAGIDRRGQRSWWERALDNTKDGFERSGVGDVLRSANPGDDGLFNLRDLTRVRDGSPVDWALDRTVGTQREWFAGDSAVPGVAQVMTGQAMRGTARAAREDGRRGDYEAKAKADPIRDPGDFLAFISGQVAGSALSPENWLGGGRAVSVSKSLGGRLLARASEQALIAGAADLGLQAGDVGAGIEDRYRPSQTLLAAGIGGVFGAALEPFGPTPERRAAPALEAGDELYAPALSAKEIIPTPPRVDPVGALPDGAEVIRRVEGGGPLPGDVWSPEQNAWLHRVDGPESDLSAKAPADSLETQELSPAPSHQDTPEGGSQAAQESTEGVSSAKGPPAAEEQAPKGWDAIDWGTRKSPERAEAASRHLADLRKWIKPEHVEAFLTAVDDGLPESEASSRINERWIDWDQMGDPHEVLKFTGAIADIFHSAYANTGGGTQGWEKTAEIAHQMGFTLSDVIKAHADVTGEGGIAARAGALRDAALASDKAFHNQLVVVRAAIEKGDKSGVPALVESLNRTVVLGAMDAGASAEIARALQYRQRKPDFAHSDLQAAMDEISRVLNTGGDLHDTALAKIVDDLSEAYDRGGSSGLRQRIGVMKELGFWDYAGYYATANLLAAPTTHIRNATGTPIHALFQIGERYVAAGIGALRTGAGLGSRERVTFREAGAYAAGTVQSWQEALTLAAAAWKRGAPVSELRSSVMSQEASSRVPFAFSPQRLDSWKANPLSLKTAGDALGTTVFEIVRTLGFRPSVATDEFFKALGRRAQINALSYREAAYRSALADPKVADAVFADTLKGLQEEPTAAAFREAREFFEGRAGSAKSVFQPGSREEEMALILRSIDHRQMAVDHARLLTFQDSGPIIDKIDAALNAVPFFKHLFVNFVRTPVSLLKAGLVTRNPLVGGPVAALELTTRTGLEKHKALLGALTAEEQALERGGAEADLVFARQVVGSAVLGTFWMLWAGGNVVGKQTPEERRSGVQDYSIKLPNGTWVQFTGMSPVGEMLGLVADTGKALRDHDLDDDGAAAMVGSLAAAVRNNVVNKSFLKGLSDFMDMMTGGTYGASSDEASGETIGRQLGEAMAPRLVPGGAFLRRVAQEEDPVIRDVRSFQEMLLQMVPTMSEAIAARRDFLGRPLVRPEGQRGVLQAFNTSSPASDPLERELADLASALPEGFRIGMSPRKLNGEDLTPAEYSHLLEVQGQLYREPRTGRNMEEELRHLIHTADYREAEATARAYRVQQVIQRWRTGANAAVRNPRSPLYMREAALRTGRLRLQQEAGRRQWSPRAARRHGLDYGLDPQDPEVIALHDALFPEE